MRVVFLGTPQVAVPSLEAFLAADDVEVVAVVTNPDRAKGRSRRPVAPPVKEAAAEAGIPVWQPAKPIELVDQLSEAAVDACAVVAYGALLPRQLLDVPRFGFVNLHFSLLPRWRGAAPVQHAIRAGDERTGITTFVLDEGMDTGPIIDQVEVPIARDESAGQLLDRLATLGAPVLVDSVRRLVGGERPRPQTDDGATKAPKVSPEDVVIDFEVHPEQLVDLVRSADPAPGAHTTFRGRRLKVLRATPVELVGAAPSPPGSVVVAGRDGVVVRCGHGAVRLDEVQPEGKARMDGPAFANGYRPEVGELLTAPV